MRRTGMFLFRDAFIEAIQHRAPMCVVHAAHAAEILLKARIAQEHPLLIFSKIPKPDPNKSSLRLIDLLESGRTLTYEELPDQLWATTGISMERVEQFRDFGKLRNQIVHFSTANANNLDKLTILYSLEVIDPLVESFWGKSVIDFIAKDPNPLYADLVHQGWIEDTLRKDYLIDERLRRLLGDYSKQACDNMISHLEDMDSFNRSKTAEDLNAEYTTWHMVIDEDPLLDESLIQLAKDKSSWEDFLDTF